MPRSAPRSTASAPTSRCFRSSPTASSCACSTTTGVETRVDLPERTALCWHGYLPDVKPGQRYGFRVHGPWAPEQGPWCNPAKLLLDPYAKAIDGSWDWNEAIFPYHFAEPETSTQRSRQRAVRAQERGHQPVLRLGPATAGRTRRGTARSSTRRTSRASPSTHPDIPDELRGTYAGMAHPVAVKYLQRLGVTAVELLPVHQFVQDSTPARPRPAQLLGLQLDRLPRAAQRVRAAASAASRCRSSSISSRRCTRRASR